ncbi:uncharacterized protein LOC132205326 isoform X2 [Neocloeon triangulifer]|uniref:uncharacterized protein LOC132205326 isoform X2 n=1 Tax=Neocloeon triangulifer TaxID=2078957 RepID=UPI00286EE0E2|nr:uncharacterized protein LOC132205326 isoform X2 [Neocloeon triangulifer]
MATFKCVKSKKERWLLTRKTWRYMADAGRKLIPEGATNKDEDLPAIEANFQEVCKKEKKFLLWRKSSYPSALKTSRSLRAAPRPGKVKDRAGSTTELELGIISARLRGARNSLPGDSLEEELNEWVDLDAAGPSRRSKVEKKPHFWNRQKSQKGKGSFESVRSLNVGQEEKDVRKSVPTEDQGTMTIDRNIRYGAGNLPVESSPDREQVRLRHVDREERDGKTDSNRESWFKGAIRKSETALHDLHQSATSRFYRPSTRNLDRSISVDETNLETLVSDDDDDNLGSGQHYSSRNYNLRHNLTLPGLSLSRPGNYPSSGQIQPKERAIARRTGKSDFFSFQSHLANWRHSPSDETKGFVPSSTSSAGSGSKGGSGGSGYHHGSEGGPSSPKSFADLRPTPSTSTRDTQTYESFRFAFKTSDLKTTFKDKNVTPATEEDNKSERAPVCRAKICDQGVQTLAISDAIMAIIDLKIIHEPKEAAPESGTQSPVPQETTPKNASQTPSQTSTPRRTSIDRGSTVDDCSPSVGDKLMRYLKMARKKSSADKPDRFKTVNYDRNLRFIKAKGPIEDENEKGVQTNESWLGMPEDPNLFEESAIFSSDSSDLGFSSRDSFDAGEMSQGQSFLSQLFSGLQHAAAMQKSKSSSHVGHHGSRLMAKKIWRTRSKSQSRATPSSTSLWTPQGQCRWTSVTGRSVNLLGSSLLQLSEIERVVLQQVALAKLQQLNLGVSIRVPADESTTPAAKPKRRPYLLKRKALTTGFFDTGRKDENKEKDGANLVFGIPLVQCIANDRLSEGRTELRRRSHHGSRTSCSSLAEAAKPEKGGSCESLPAGILEVASDDDPISPSVPHLVSTCCNHISKYGLSTLGIFRVSSSKKRVRQLRDDFDSGRDVEMAADLCPHDAAALLKEFFRDLPDPLMSRELYPAFIQTQRIRNRRLQLEALCHLVQLLPVANRDTLATLLTFLNNVSQNAGDRKNDSGEVVAGNKMDSTNLATLFAPNILHCFKQGAKEVDKPEERSDAINVTRSLIDHHAEVFEVSAELLDEVYLHMMDSHPDTLDQLLRKLCYGSDDLADDGDNSVFEGSEGGSSVPRTPTEGTLTPVSITAEDPQRGWADSPKKVWTREEFLHETAGMGGPDLGNKGRERSKKRGKEEESTSRWFQGSRKREKSSSEEGRRRRSGGSEPATPITSPPTLSFPSSRSPSLDASGVITASLKIPFSLDDIPYIEDERTTRSRPSTDSAIGSTLSPVSGASSPSDEGISGRILIPTKVTIEPKEKEEPSKTKLMTSSESKLQVVTSGSKVTTTLHTVLRKVERTPSAKEEKKKYTRRRYSDTRHQTVNFPDVEALESAGAAPASDSNRASQKWKRRELIASDPKEHETFV